MAGRRPGPPPPHRRVVPPRLRRGHLRPGGRATRRAQQPRPVEPLHDGRSRAHRAAPADHPVAQQPGRAIAARPHPPDRRRRPGREAVGRRAPPRGRDRLPAAVPVDVHGPRDPRARRRRRAARPHLEGTEPDRRLPHPRAAAPLHGGRGRALRAHRRGRDVEARAPRRRPGLDRAASGRGRRRDEARARRPVPVHALPGGHAHHGEPDRAQRPGADATPLAVGAPARAAGPRRGRGRGAAPLRLDRAVHDPRRPGGPRDRRDPDRRRRADGGVDLLGQPGRGEVGTDGGDPRPQARRRPQPHRLRQGTPRLRRQLAGPARAARRPRGPRRAVAGPRPRRPGAHLGDEHDGHPRARRGASSPSARDAGEPGRAATVAFRTSGPSR